MTEPTFLIVPVDVAALCVGTPDAQGHGTQPAKTMGPMADFSVLPWVGGGSVHNRGPYISPEALANSAPFAGDLPLQTGIYLHWALPDGLTGATAGDSATTFPAAPNRWLLNRIVTSGNAGGDTRTTVRSWVVESDRCSAEPTAPAGIAQPTIPLAADGHPNFAYLGAAFDLAGWTEVGDQQPRLTPFTAVGYGQITFASFFPNCSTVFGYYDPLTDLTGFDPATDRISYQVSGWYSDPATDPLNQPGAVPTDFRWLVSGTGTPTRIACSGIVADIPWNPATQFLKQPAKPLAVALGPSTREALSALLAAALNVEDPGQYPDAEQILNALQYGTLGANLQAGSLAALEEDVHGSGFNAFAGGQIWTVATSADGAAEGEEVTLPDDLAEQLNALNVAQLQLNDANLQLASLQRQLFAGWFKYQLVEYDPGAVPPELRTAAQQVQIYLSARVDDISNLQTLIGTIEGQVDAKATSLRHALGTGLVLTNATVGPRFYGPADPAMILCGPDTRPSPRYGGDGRGSDTGYLHCRLDSDLVVSVELPAKLVAGSSTVTIADSDLPALVAQPAGAPSALLQELLRESLLIVPSLQAALTTEVAALGGAANPAVLDRAGTAAALATAATAFIGGGAAGGVTYGGGAPSAPYLSTWLESPWIPLILQYDVEYEPVLSLAPEDASAAYPANFINANFALAPDMIDLELAAPAPATSPQRFTGSVLLTPSGVVDMRGELDRFEKSTGVTDPELAAISRLLGELPLLNQSAGGLTGAMAMRLPSLQMPIADPLAAESLAGFITSVATAVGKAVMDTPLPGSPFNPIRAGALRVRRLRLVDAFGRTRQYLDPATVVARTLRPLSGHPANTAFLPPRLTQPARLLFRWHAADDDAMETNSDPATTPVVGWIVPNLLDQGFLLYDGAGTALGELALSGDRKSVLWSVAPGGAFPFGTDIATVMANQNPHLADFALGVFDNGDAAFFAPFFETVRNALALMLPQRYREAAALSALVGQPLAIARAGLNLQVAGELNSNQSWQVFADAVLNGEPLSDGGLSKVEFPIKLGALTELDDTLVGYWIADDQGKTDFRSFYSEAAAAGSGGVHKPVQTTLTVKPSTVAAGGKTVTVLMDPRGAVHATTGILPVKEITIPREQYGPMLESLAVTFSIQPVLAGGQPVSAGPATLPAAMVLPKVPQGTWSWIQVDGEAWATGLPGNSAAAATLDYSPQILAEGWLQLAGATNPTRRRRK